MHRLGPDPLEKSTLSKEDLDTISLMYPGLHDYLRRITEYGLFGGDILDKDGRTVGSNDPAWAEPEVRVMD